MILTLAKGISSRDASERIADAIKTGFCALREQIRQPPDAIFTGRGRVGSDRYALMRAATMTSGVDSQQ
jgi:hypothetical protein